jgi:hypothetical protein
MKMQLDIPATELDLIEGDAAELEDFNLGVEIAKSLTISATQTVGMVAGFVVVAYAWDAGTKLYKRFSKKKPELYVVTDMPEAAEN